MTDREFALFLVAKGYGEVVVRAGDVMVPAFLIYWPVKSIPRRNGRPNWSRARVEFHDGTRRSVRPSQVYLPDEVDA